MCRTAGGNNDLQPFCGTVTSALGANPVAVGVCGQCQTLAPDGDGPPSDCKASSGSCAQGTCETGELCCANGSCKLFRSECGEDDLG